MDFALSANQESIREAVGKICSRFDDAYWLKKDKEGGYPADFHRALADCSPAGIAVRVIDVTKRSLANTSAAVTRVADWLTCRNPSRRKARQCG